jgi:uncharacterized damage-inducible protein DinB
MMLAFTRLLADYEGIRLQLLDSLAGLSEEKARRIPPGGKNHVHWHVGHLLHMQCSFLYTRCGLVSPLPRGFRDYFGRGTSAESHDSLTPDWDELLKLARRHSTDLAAKHGEKFSLPLGRPFALMNVRAVTVGEAMTLLLVHEGEHRARIHNLLALE